MSQSAVTDSLALASIGDEELKEAVGRFYYDVLGEAEKSWSSPTDAKDWKASRHPRPSAIVDHLRGKVTYGVGPIGRAIVIDHDSERTPSGEEEVEATKAEARAAVSLLLDSFGIPHVHFDGARGAHTWIRLDRDATEAELAAL